MCTATLRHFAISVVAPSFDKQLHLADLVGDLDWRLDLAAGLLHFGDRFTWQVQILGTESHENNTWLWAWANEGSNIPEPLLQASLALRQYGDEHQIPELVEPMFQLGDVDGYFLALIASGLCDADAYYRAPYEGGAAYLLIMDETFPRYTDPPVARIASVFPQAISSLDISNHRAALAGYLDYYGLAGEEDGNTLVVKEEGVPVLTATFDEQERLTKLEATVQPAAVR